MHTNAQVFFDKRTTATTGLRGVRGGYKRDVTTSLYRFVAQQRLECAESSVMSRQGQVRIAQHKIEVEIFESNQAVGIRQPVSEFVQEVFADISDVFMQFGNQQPFVFATIAARDGATKTPLRPAEFSQWAAQPAGIVNQRAVREGQQAQQAHIAAHTRQTVWFHFNIGHFQHQIGVPTRRFTLNNDMFDLGFVRQEAVQLNLDTAYILHSQRKAIKGFIVVQFAPVAVGVLNALEAVLAFETGITWCLARLDTPKECAKR